MTFPLLVLPILLSTSLVGGAIEQIHQAPYQVPNDHGDSWPSITKWEALNSTLGGRLQELRPWAAVCYTDDPLYDPVNCQTVLSSYTNDSARETIPSALLWTNWESCGYENGCALNYSDPQPVSGQTCHQGTTPPYSVAISSAEDASKIIKWATANNVKLTIKNTGHDYLGRSSGPSSLQVLTHDLKGVAYIPDFIPQGLLVTPVPAITINAGAQLEDIYPVMEENNVSAVLGGCLTVGAAGGFIQAGGYGILSPAHGLAVDHLLEVEIVTADGVIRKINSVQDPDLFWAVRGGGAESWGIIISITAATLPPTAISTSSLVIVPNASQDLRTLGVNFIALVGKYQNQIINSGITSTVVFVGGAYSLEFLWPAEKASVSLLYPLFDEIRALADNYTVLSNTTQESMYPSITTAIIENVSPSADAVSFYGGSTELASRFVPQSMLETPESVQSVAVAIWEGLQIANATMENRPAGVFNPQVDAILFGDMPAATKNRVNETGANPGFYNAAWHVLYPRSWTVGTSWRTYRALTQAVYDAVGPLTALGLTSSYQNEGSAWETYWQQAFFGYKYDRLLQIKQQYDPTNFFTTFKVQGVGFETSVSSALYSCYQVD